MCVCVCVCVLVCGQVGRNVFVAVFVETYMYGLRLHRRRQAWAGTLVSRETLPALSDPVSLSLAL